MTARHRAFGGSSFHFREDVMEERVLGRTDRPVSVVGLGTWQIGGNWGEVSEESALGVLEAAV